MLTEDEQRLHAVEDALDSAAAAAALRQCSDSSSVGSSDCSSSRSSSSVVGQGVDRQPDADAETAAAESLLVGTAPLPAPVCAALLAVSAQFLKIAQRPRARRAERRRFARLSLAYAFRATEEVAAPPLPVAAAGAGSSEQGRRSARLAVARALKALGDFCGARDYLVLSGAAKSDSAAAAAAAAVAAAMAESSANVVDGETDREMLEELQRAMVDELKSMDKLQDPEQVAAQGLSTPVKEKVVKGLGPKRLAALRDAADPDSPLTLELFSPEKRSQLPKGAHVDTLVKINNVLSPSFKLRPTPVGSDGQLLRTRDEANLIQLLRSRLAERHGAPKLRVGSWNIRVTRPEHGIRAPKPGADVSKSKNPTSCIRALLPKLHRLTQMLHDEGMAVAALQECPGLGVDPSLTVLHQFLRQLAPSPEKLVESQPLDDAGAHHMNLNVAWTLTHSEASAFVYDANVLDPVALDDRGRCCGVCLLEADESEVGSDECDAAASAAEFHVSIRPVQETSEWRAVWPELSAVSVMTRLVQRVTAQLRAAQDAENLWLEAQRSARQADAGADDLPSPGLPCDLEESAADVLWKLLESAPEHAQPDSVEGALAGPKKRPVPPWFKRPPTVALFRCRAGQLQGQIIGLVSVHLKAGENGSWAATQDEVRLLPQVLRRAEELVAQAGGGALLLLGDFNLAPPGDVASKCACGDAFDGVLDRGYQVLLPNEDGRLATNVDKLVSAATGGRQYDNCFFKNIEAPQADEINGPRIWSASAQVLLDDVFTVLASSFQRGRSAAVDAIQELGTSIPGDQALPGAASRVAQAHADAVAFFAPPEKTQGKLATTFTNTVYNNYSDHKALAVALTLGN